MSKKIKTRTVRVLCEVRLDGETYHPNDLVELPADLVEPLEQTGMVDATPAAVRYVQNELGAQLKRHPLPEQQEVAPPPPEDPPSDPQNPPGEG